MFRYRSLATALTTILIAGSTPTAPADISYRVTPLVPYPPVWESGPIVIPADINDAGQVCGQYANSTYFAFIRDPLTGQLQDIGSIGCGPSANPAAISQNGFVAGTDGDAQCNARAWLWTPESGMVNLGALPFIYPESWGNGINSSGHVVGWSNATQTGRSAFLWTPEIGMINLAAQPNGLFIEARDINDAGWIVGEGFTQRGYEAVVLTPAGMITLGGVSRANAINDVGQVVGVASSPQGTQAFLWDSESGMIGLGFLCFDGDLGLRTEAYDVNNRGEVVGEADNHCSEDYTYSHFVWDARRGMRNLDLLMDPCTPPNRYRVSAPIRINNPGQIVGDNGSVIDGPGMILTPYLPGDLDNDGDVQLDDLATLLTNFGRTGDATYADGDIEGCDRDVDLRDLTVLLSNYGETYP